MKQYKLDNILIRLYNLILLFSVFIYCISDNKFVNTLIK